MAFEPEKVNRKGYNFRLLPDTYETIKELAALYGSSQSKIIDALAKTYGPSLKRDANK